MAELVGTFNRLTVRYRVGSDDHGNALYFCDCFCGGTKIAPASDIRNGKVPSCGCLKYKQKHGACTKENNRSSSEYRTWTQMKARCSDSNHPDYASYGGRGISVCERWLRFEDFIIDIGLRPPGGMLERMNNDGNYEPSNCCWATLKQQCRNRRSNRVLTAFGRSQTLIEWSEETGLRPTTISWRLSHGWSVEDAVGQPSSR